MAKDGREGVVFAVPVGGESGGGPMLSGARADEPQVERSDVAAG